MAKIYPDSTAIYLNPLLGSEHGWIRTDAVAVANQILDTKTLPYLKLLIHDEYYEIRFLARQAISRIEAER